MFGRLCCMDHSINQFFTFAFIPSLYTVSVFLPVILLDSTEHRPALMTKLNLNHLSCLLFFSLDALQQTVEVTDDYVPEQQYKYTSTCMWDSDPRDDRAAGPHARKGRARQHFQWYGVGTMVLTTKTNKKN